MITTSVKIEMIKGDGELTSASVANDKFMSVISSDINRTVNKATAPPIVSPFYLGFTRFSETRNVYMSTGKKVPYFVGGYISDNDGNFPITYNIELLYSAKGKNSVVIVFDEENGGHPKSVTVDGGTQITDDDAQYEIAFDSDSDIHTIAISSWNKPNEPLIITRMFANLEVNIDYNRLREYNVTIEDRASTSGAQYGIKSNSGTVTIQDTDGSILDIIKQQLITHNKVEIFYNDDSDTIQQEERIVYMFTDNVQYDNDSGEVTITIKDDIEDLQKMSFSPLEFYPTISKPKSFKEIYEYLATETRRNGIDILTYNELDRGTKTVLAGIVEYPYIDSTTLWGAWDALCNATLSHMYKNSDNIIVFKHDI